MLTLSQVHAGYNDSEVLHGIDLQLQQGEVVTLLGRNGMGKTTTIHCIIGLLETRSGSIEFNGVQLNSIASYQIARLGVGLVPENRHIFPNLSVTENLVVAAANYSGSKTPWNLETIFQLFPRLGERQQHSGNQLSGGEQQMLAIGRALMTNPRFLTIDEPSLGLAPKVVRQIFEIIRKINTEHKTTIFLVEQNANLALHAAHRGYVMENGKIVLEDTAERLLSNENVKKAYLGV